MQQEIYLDNSATTKPYFEVAEYIHHINHNIYGNPSSLHKKGIEAEKLIKKAREAISQTLKVSDKEIIYTSGGTEANNLAILGYLEANPRKGKHIITTEIEHPSVLEVYKNLSQKGYEVDYLPVDPQGYIKLEHLKTVIRPDTSMVSIIYVNNETGVIQPIGEISKIIKACNKETVLHVDGVQAYGKLALYPKTMGIDLLSFSSHKIHGPKGVGALYITKNVRIKPILQGGGQEALLRSGTENVSGICGFGLAAEIITKNLSEQEAHVKRLKYIFLEKLSEISSNYDMISTDEALPNILSISFSGIKAEVLLHHLEERNIFVSTGSACSSRKKLHSHVLKAMGIAPKKIEGTLRFSFSPFNTEEEMRVTVEAIKEILPKITVKSFKNRLN